MHALASIACTTYAFFSKRKNFQIDNTIYLIHTNKELQNIKYESQQKL